MKNIFVLLLLTVAFTTFGQTFEPPITGPGSANYLHQEVAFHDYADKEDGYWLFEPASPKPKTTNLIVFLHGYGGYNPMIYGQWIKHLVKKGNTVIYPRYQRNVLSPSPKKFSKNVVTAIKDALTLIADSDKHIPVNLASLCLVGHSYGGIIGANISVNWKDFEIPKPKGIFLCAPGTGPFNAGKLETYEAMPTDIKLLVMVNENDYIVGDEMGVKIFETATNTPQRNLIRQYSDYDNGISAGHNESYCVDEDFDTGTWNYTTKKALRVSKLNAVDYYGYWKLFDALIDCSRVGENCQYAFGNTPEQRNLGSVVDGELVRELEVKVAKNVRFTAKK